MKITQQRKDDGFYYQNIRHVPNKSIYKLVIKYLPFNSYIQIPFHTVHL